MFSTLLVFAAVVSSVSAAYISSNKQTSDCDIKEHASMRLPPGQTALVQPTIPPSYVVLALGVQNYTCTDGKYVNIGALAELFDISCLYELPFAEIQDKAYDYWSSPRLARYSAADVVKHLHDIPQPAALLGHHYFIPNPINASGPASPSWDFIASTHEPTAFIVASKVASIPAPSGPKDVDWLSLKNVQGDLASQVFRVDTRGGQPPASCTSGSAVLSVKYTSKYWLYGGTIKYSEEDNQDDKESYEDDNSGDDDENDGDEDDN